jgi:very-short-patch-repair endonuclease
MEAVAEGRLVRVRRAVYSPQPLEPRGAFLLHDGRVDAAYLAEVRAVLLEMGPRAMAGGRTAALLWGWDLAVEPTDVEIVLPPGGITKREGVAITRLAHPVSVPRHLLGFAPVAVLSAVQTVMHCALTLPVSEAVAVADSALRAKSVTMRELRKAVSKHHGKTGYRRLRKVLLWCDERSGSVLESLFRVLVLSSGIVRPSSQVTIVHGGRTMVVDFCWKDLRLVVECDGRRFHDPSDMRTKDRWRDHALESSSWRVLRFTWADIVHNPDYVVATVRSCLQGWRSAA